MADEKFDTEQEELDAVADQASELTEEAAQAVTDVVEEAAAEAEEAVEAVEVEETVVDERVEAAVRHVAEEAAADASILSDDDKLEEELTAKRRRERRSKQARAAKAEKAGEAADSASKQPAKVGGLAGLGVGAWCGISIICLALGLLLGRFVLGGGSSAGGASMVGSTTVTEEQLDSAFATYTYNGTDQVITVREVIDQTSTLDDAKDDEGNYKLPSAEYALTVARNKILMAEVESRGITVSDDDVSAYAEENLGTSDYDALGSTYGMDPDMVKQLIEENCRVNALREEVVGAELPAMPEAPEAPEEGAEDKATKAYAKYIIDLAGDEWDADKGTWASEDGRYATALADYKVTKKSATYEAAETAYYLAYQIYSEKQTELNETWTTFYNGLMSNASIQVSTLVS